MAAMDLVMRVWARQLKLSASDLMVIMLLGQRGARSGADLAMFSGRRRQQTQRTLAHLHERGLLRPARRDRKGHVHAWELTEHGQACLDAVATRAREWEALLEGRLDLESVAGTLRHMVEVIVRYPVGGKGWEEALNSPLEPIDRDPKAVLEALRREANAVVVPEPPPDEARAAEGAAGGAGGSGRVSKVDAKEAKADDADDWDAVARAIHAMWQ